MNASPTHASPPAPFVQRRARWPLVRRRAAWLGALAAMTAVLGGCVGFTEPVASLPGGEVDPSPYIGTWTIEQATVIVIEQAEDGTNTLLGSARSVDGYPDAPATLFTVGLSNVNGRVVASIRSDEVFGSDQPLWAIAAVDIEPDGMRMTVRGLDVDGIEAAVESGDLPGRQVEQDGSTEVVGALVIESDGTALLEYLSRSPDAFQFADATVLVRGEPSAEVLAESLSEGLSDGPDAAYLPTAISGSSRGDPMSLSAQPPQPPAYGGYPGQPGSDPWAQPPTDFGGSTSPMGIAPGMPTQYVPTPNMPTPFGGGASILPDASMPASVKGIVAALGFLIVLGLAAAMAVDYVRRRQRADRPDAEGNANAAAVFAGGRTAADAGRRPTVLETLRRNVWPALLVLVIAVGPLLYLGVLLGSLAFPSWIVLQPGVQGMLHSLAPYVLVFSIGALIALAEVVTTFPAFAAEALGTKWATVLVAFNALGTTIAYSAVVTYASNHDHPLLRALAIAAGFAVLIRTRFVLARDLGGREAGDGASIDLGWPYARIQQLCRQRIDRELLRDPRYATSRLLSLFPDTAKLQQYAADSVRTRDPSESADLRASLDAIVVDDVDPGLVRARIARFIVATGGLGHTVFLIDHAESDDTQ